MTDLQLDVILGAIMQDFPESDWLIRTDKERGFFANIMTKGSSPNSAGFFRAYGPTKEDALYNAFTAATGMPL